MSVNTPSQARSGKEKLPERLIFGQRGDVYILRDAEQGASIADADSEVIAAELVRRWNAHEEMVKALEKRIENCCEPDGSPDGGFSYCQQCKDNMDTLATHRP